VAVVAALTEEVLPELVAPEAVETQVLPVVIMQGVQAEQI
jgi:hypothetical protein